MEIQDILIPALWFALLGGVLGLLLAIASKIFAVKQDERIPEITEQLPGANCGGCGYAGCAAYAEAIVNGEAKIGACAAAGPIAAKKIAEIMGTEAGEVVRMRAQVMCAGTHSVAKRKYLYEGADDCVAAERLGGGDKLCPNGCLGLGSCVGVCKFHALSVKDGVAQVDPALCTGCGVCVQTCPKKVIRLIPRSAVYFVACSSADNGKTTRSYCDVGCIACKICEKNCPESAITVNDGVASIDYTKCSSCGVCAEKCPRKIIRSTPSMGKQVKLDA